MALRACIIAAALLLAAPAWGERRYMTGFELQSNAESVSTAGSAGRTYSTSVKRTGAASFVVDAA
jgi:hypothetical protein